MTVRILTGDVRAVLPTLPDDSVHCCVTSPPYWGLRSYLPADHPNKPFEIGSEPTLQEWVDTMVEVFREVRRILRPDGTLWLNLGDSYATGTSAPSQENKGDVDHGAWAKSAHLGRRRADVPELRAKNLIGQPWRVAFALQADGWWLRQEIIWAKKNPMPESIRDRFTKAHEHVFLLSKSERYFFDFDAVQEPVEGGAHARLPGNKTHKHATAYALGDEHARTKAGLVAYAERQRAQYKTPDGWDTRTGKGGHGSFDAEGREKGTINDGVGRRQVPPGNPAERKLAEAGSGTKNNGSFDDAMAVMPSTRNPRSVRWVASEPFKGAHFATYPAELIRPFVLAGCPPGGTVLDPFGGSGTTGLVADQHGRNAVLVDLDERNAPMATERIKADSSLFAEVTP